MCVRFASCFWRQTKQQCHNRQEISTHDEPDSIIHRRRKDKCPRQNELQYLAIASEMVTEYITPTANVKQCGDLQNLVALMTIFVLCLLM